MPQTQMQSYFDQVLVLLQVPLQAQVSQKVLITPLDQLVENVEVPLPVVLVDHARLLEQIVDDVTSYWGSLPTEQRPAREGGGRVGEGEAGALRCDLGLILTCRFHRDFVVHNK